MENKEIKIKKSFFFKTTNPHKWYEFNKMDRKEIGYTALIGILSGIGFKDYFFGKFFLLIGLIFLIIWIYKSFRDKKYSSIIKAILIPVSIIALVGLLASFALTYIKSQREKVNQEKQPVSNSIIQEQYKKDIKKGCEDIKVGDLDKILECSRNGTPQ